LNVLLSAIHPNKQQNKKELAFHDPKLKVKKQALNNARDSKPRDRRLVNDLFGTESQEFIRIVVMSNASKQY
jgi:hypothetical protein